MLGIHHTPGWVQALFPKFIWHMSRNEKNIYLTFDDGPIPDVTPFVLNELRKYKAKATFFCVGDNINKHPQVFEQLVQEGHAVGNHTFNHIKGWQTQVVDYLQNVNLCEQQINRKYTSGEGTRLFRPPYGRITGKQARELLPSYRIIMWDVLSRDYDKSLSKERCLKKTAEKTKNGSIIVFHDSLKAFKNLEWVLPRYLEKMNAQGFSFKTI